MLVRGLKGLVPIIGPLLILIVLGLKLYGGDLNIFPFNGNPWRENGLGHDANGSSEGSTPGTHRELFSVSTTDRKYFMIDFGEHDASNPNIISHPSLDDTWIIVAQLQKSSIEKSVWFAELVCDATFKGGALRCIKPPVILPIAATIGDAQKCAGDLSFFSFSIGPHDARVFYGPQNPYAIYGSNSVYTCFGQWMIDFRMLVDWGFEGFAGNEFRIPRELQKAAPYNPIEKNWFVFWDNNQHMYIHYDVAPRRVFAKLENDGSVGMDIAGLAAANDEKCMEKFMPLASGELESIHQATNSLSITLCDRSNPNCKPDDFNTFIFTIFQRKSYHSFHSEYEPYVMLFKQTDPFEVFAISTKPLWIHGRERHGAGKRPDSVGQDSAAWNQTEMFYVTSMSWKSKGQKYHGYKDDILFIGFGIEDSKAAGIDVLAGDLLKDLGLCFEV